MSDSCNSKVNGSHSEELNGSDEQPIAVLILGMAGTGKTTLTTSLISHLQESKVNVFSTNLDPAVLHVNYPANIDIRDTINYKELMKDTGLGPNGAIMTAMNLFALKMDKVMDILTKRASTNKYFLFDAPGQIEMFTWSTSGTVISETLASTFPTVIIYVMDTPRNVDENAFASNMLYACSIYMTYRIPFIIALNKTDVVDCGQIKEWIGDSMSFGDDMRGMQDLTRRIILTFEKFYNDLKVVGISSKTGEGLEELVQAIDQSKMEYERDYKAMWKIIAEKKSKVDGNRMNTLTLDAMNDMPIKERGPYMIHPCDYDEEHVGDGD